VVLMTHGLVATNNTIVVRHLLYGSTFIHTWGDAENVKTLS
jgi:hypothetical protein